MDVSRTNEPMVNGTSTTEEMALVDKKKLLRKIDFRLLLILVIMNILACLDRSNIGNARLAGLENNLGLYGNQFQISLAVFYIGYVLFEIPSNMVISKFTPSKWIPALMVIWSAVICCMAAASNFGELIATRFLLGVAESGFTPGAFFLLSMWYKRSQYAIRFSLFYSGSVLSGAFGGLLAYLITKYMNGNGSLEGWRWLFLLEGIATFVFSLASFFILPNFPETATFLTVQERDYWVTSLRKDDYTLNDLRKDDYTLNGLQQHKITHYSLYLVIKDLKIYIEMLIGLFIGTTLNSIALYLPTVIHSMGFDPLESQLLTVPPYFVGWFISLAITLHSDKVEERSFHIVFGGCLAMIGFFGLAMIDSVNLLYASTFFCIAGVSTIAPLSVAWLTSIFSIPHDKRAIAQAMFFATANFSDEPLSLEAPWEKGEVHCLDVLTPTPGIMLNPNDRVWIRWQQNKSCHPLSDFEIKLHGSPNVKEYSAPIASNIMKMDYEWIAPVIPFNNVKNNTAYYIKVTTKALLDSNSVEVTVFGLTGPITISRKATTSPKTYFSPTNTTNTNDKIKNATISNGTKKGQQTSNCNSVISDFFVLGSN
ncbi:27046_t:CDS:10, partial [Dentiscutata erythropus]